jgi:hypothetical protein
MRRSKTQVIAERSLREGRLEGIIDGPKSGRWGKWKYYMRGKTQCCQRYVKPRDPRTAAQVQAREGMERAAKAWGAKLTPEQRDAWNEAAKREMSKPRLGQAGHLLGEESFVEHGTVLLKTGRELALWPTPRPVFKANPVAGLSVTQGRDGLRLSLWVNEPTDHDIIVSGQKACSAGREKWRNGACLCVLPAGAGGDIDITAGYVARCGEPEPGKKVFVRTEQQRDGWKDFPKDLSAVVPVRAGAGECGARNGECGMGSTEQGRAASLGPDGLEGLQQSYKLQDVNGLSGSEGLRQDGAAVSGPEGLGVRCTRGWFRVGTVAAPWHYRSGERAGWHIANGKWQTECVGGRHPGGHWRELWQGT